MADEVKIGAYICKGCDLGNRLNADQLEMIATREGRAAVAKTHDFLCGEDGVKMIKDDLAAGDVNRVVIAACSRRAKTGAFTFEQTATRIVFNFDTSICSFFNFLAPGFGKYGLNVGWREKVTVLQCNCLGGRGDRRNNKQRKKR